MIITFSGTDGVGKSTQLLKIMELLKSRGIDFRVQYVRGGNTPSTIIYQKIVSKIFRDNASINKPCIYIGIAFAWIELAYYWIIKLRFINEPDRIVLCDRYLWDTYVDLQCKYPEWRGDSLLWKILEKTSPTPDLSILYTASASQIAERMRKKGEVYSLPRIEAALKEYSFLHTRFTDIIEASGDVDVVFAKTIQIMKESNYAKQNR